LIALESATISANTILVGVALISIALVLVSVACVPYFACHARPTTATSSLAPGPIHSTRAGPSRPTLSVELAQRLQDRLEVRYAIAPEVLNAAVPNLILLPLAESAIANGISVRSGRATIEIRALAENGELRLEVRETATDAGSSAPLSAAPPVDQSFVTKTRLRLELLYPGRHLIGMSERRENGHEVSITLPLEEAGLRPAGASLSA